MEDISKKIGILMLHGFTACPSQFDELASFFSDRGFVVSTPLIAGHGKTPEDLNRTTVEDWKKSVKSAYIDLRNQVEKTFIIGNSFGGNLGFWLVREFNNEPSGIITLGAPIWLRYHNFILLRLNTYGIFRKYYKKPKRVYKNFSAFIKCLFAQKDTDLPYAPKLGYAEREVIPTRSLRYFLNFIKNDTRRNLGKINTPVFITHSLSDTVVKPQSAEYIYNSIGSLHKKIYWFESNRHVIMYDEKRIKLFKKIHSFIKEFS